MTSGSPGERRMRTNTMIVTRNATGTMSTRRRRMYLPIAPPPRFRSSSRSLRHRHELEPDDLVRVDRRCHDLLRGRELRGAEAEPDACRVVHDVDLLGLAERVPALRLVGGGALLVEQLVHLSVRVRRVVERPLGVDVVVCVPVGV